MFFNKAIAQTETNVKARILMLDCWLEVGLHPAKISVIFLSPRANAELVLKFHVALQGSHLALPMGEKKNLL
jgi:hypothetical protein